ncbi:2,3-bisphosphoglycerate-independent phosphoglycerate mutase [Sulfuriflexus mobilis]|uniref:2,3-bisphosphoglycerate-independent phosphoglycerate mutase n=1 Tax=Sulfuriflexus mobilis TaxID=1811807 RepID=UPI000F817B04|nr:2,3-bisphosphoglycerate-independent phosphoglycerate mutase [Sulfuriflexus mobilis]
MATISGVPRRPVVLIILDGYGINPSKLNNAVYEAPTPRLDDYFSHYPHTLLSASGHAVGLPDGQMGNSEVGHLTLGAGEIIRQDMVRINDAIVSGEFFHNPTLLYTINKAKQANRPIHLFGLVSDGGVHSHIDHVYALIESCRRHGVKILLHMITDGRDTPPQSALVGLAALESRLNASGGAIASIMGRYYAMDRDNRWDRTELAWRAMVLGKGQAAVSAETAIRAAYAAGDTDEFIRPILLPPFQPIEPGEQVISFNFRKDRPRQIVAALGKRDFSGFDRGNAPLAEVTCMVPYSKQDNLPYLFESEHPAATLGQVISTLGLAQFHCAETEKYPHVTYFLNGGRAEPYSGETQLLIPSPNVSTYDLKPQMSAAEVADGVIQAISSGRYGFIVVNFANGDMVGHTAKRHAILTAIKTLDREVGRVLDAAVATGYSVVLTADHGNCEEMVDPLTGAPHTQHTTYPVPCLIMDEVNWKLSCESGLSSIAPTVLELMGIQPPASMTSPSLLLQSFKREAWKQAPENLQGVA